MAQDFTAVKSSFITYATKIAGQMLELALLCDEFSSEYFAKAFNSGAANQIVDGDCTGLNSFLTAAIVGNVVTQSQLVSNTFTSSVRNTLRQAVPTAQPPALP